MAVGSTYFREGKLASYRSSLGCCFQSAIRKKQNEIYNQVVHIYE